jgi:hypothetical protein
VDEHEHEEPTTNSDAHEEPTNSFDHEEPPNTDKPNETKDEIAGVDDASTYTSNTTGVGDDPAVVNETAGVADEENIEEDMNNRYGQRTGQHNLRPRRKPSEKYQRRYEHNITAGYTPPWNTMLWHNTRSSRAFTFLARPAKKQYIQKYFSYTKWRQPGQKICSLEKKNQRRSTT